MKFPNSNFDNNWHENWSNKRKVVYNPRDIKYSTNIYVCIIDRIKFQIDQSLKIIYHREIIEIIFPLIFLLLFSFQF